jgi:hypothetical protein
MLVFVGQRRASLPVRKFATFLRADSQLEKAALISGWRAWSAQARFFKRKEKKRVFVMGKADFVSSYFC